MRHFPDGEASGPLEAYVQLLSTLHAATGHEQDLPEVRSCCYTVETEASHRMVATVQVNRLCDSVDWHSMGKTFIQVWLAPRYACPITNNLNKWI